jgi:AcrR family transcriptional regulator
MSRRAAKEKIRDARQALYQEHILDAAEKIFAELGYEEAKVVAMAKAAGLSLATVYGTFETKWDVYRAVHARRTAALRAHLAARVSADQGALGVMLDGIEASFEFHMQNPSYLRMHLRDGYAWSMPKMLRCPEELEAWNEGITMAVSAFEVGIQAGLYVDDRPQLMARMMFAMQQVRLADWIERGMKESVAEVTRDAQAQFIRTFCTPKFAAEWRSGRRAARPPR